MVIIGIDPGQSGGIACFTTASAAVVTKMPDTERDVFDFLWEYSPAARSGDSRPRFAHAFIESVHSMPKQGVSSSFKFGRGYGFLRGCLIGLDIPFEEVTPQKWQKELGCMSKGDKNVTKAKAQQLFPHLKITHHLADALLICEYGRRIVNQRERDELKAILP